MPEAERTVEITIPADWLTEDEGVGWVMAPGVLLPALQAFAAQDNPVVLDNYDLRRPVGRVVGCTEHADGLSLTLALTAAAADIFDDDGAGYTIGPMLAVERFTVAPQGTRVLTQVTVRTLNLCPPEAGARGD